MDGISHAKTILSYSPEAVISERNIHFHQTNNLFSLDGQAIARSDTGESKLISKRKRKGCEHEEEKKREKGARTKR